MFDSFFDPICIIATLIFLVIGFVLHGKIIQTSKREKDMTWQLDFAHSCIAMIHFVHYPVMYIVTFLIEDLYLYTGSWFCYLSKIMTSYGQLYIQGHSLMVGLMKFFFIVHWQKAQEVGHERAKTLFFYLHLLHPAFTTVVRLIIRPNFFWAWDGHPHFDRCMGDPKNNWVPNTNTTQTKLHSLCMDLVSPPPGNHLEYAVYIFRSAICWLHLVIFYLILWNIFDIFLYFSIFKFMRR